MRNYQRKTNRGMVPQEVMLTAALQVIEHGKKLREVSTEFNIHLMTLRRFINKLKSGENPKVGYKSNLYFTEHQEREIANYLMQYDRNFFGLTNDVARKLAYQCVVRLKYSIPSGWFKNGIAGREWLQKFTSRHRQIRLRPLKLTSERSKRNIYEFYNTLSKLLDEYKFLPSRIYHLVESSVTPILQYCKPTNGNVSVAVGQGKPVNILLAANASGETIPPMFVQQIADHKPVDGPDRLVVETVSGQITTTEFQTYIDHLIQHTKPNHLDPVLLLLQDCPYVVDVNTLEKAKDNSIILLFFPPYNVQDCCIQPLQEIATKFKSSCKTALVKWLQAHPGKTVTSDKIPKIVGKVMPSNSDIKKAFRNTGVCPFKPSVVTREKFVPSIIAEPVYYDKLNAQPGSSGGSSLATTLSTVENREIPPKDPRDQCRFCAEFTMDCHDVTNKHQLYLDRNKTTLTLNDLSIEVDFKDNLPKTVCRVCNRKLQEIHNFLKKVQVAQDTLFSVQDNVENVIETVTVKMEPASPIDDVDDIESKDGIIDSITVTETEFVKPVKHKRKIIEVTPKLKKPKVANDKEILERVNSKVVIKEEKSETLVKSTSKCKRESDEDTRITKKMLKVTREENEKSDLIIDIKEETLDSFDMYEAEHLDNEEEGAVPCELDTETDIKPSEFDYAYSSLSVIDENDKWTLR